MTQIIPKITIEGREVDFIQAKYAQPGILSAASLSFNLPLGVAGTENLWNKEVTLYVDKGDSKPIFRGWINRTKKDSHEVQVIAEDGIGYMIKGGDTTLSIVVLDDKQNRRSYYKTIRAGQIRFQNKDRLYRRYVSTHRFSSEGTNKRNTIGIRYY